MFRSLIFIILCIGNSLTLADQTTKSILVIGDSISAAYGIRLDSGWVNLLALQIAKEKHPYQVINASISGDTTINGVKRLAPLLKRHKVDIVIIELGGNDGLRGLSLKVMKKNLKTMIDMSQQAGASVLLAGMKIPPNYGKRYTQLVYKTYSDLSHEYKLPYIPFLLEGVGDKKELMQKDGLHPTQEAQVIILNTVWNKLEQML